MPGLIIWPFRACRLLWRLGCGPDQYRSDVCNITASFGFVQCNMIMDDMHYLHVKKTGLSRRLKAKSAMVFFMFR